MTTYRLTHKRAIAQPVLLEGSTPTWVIERRTRVDRFDDGYVVEYLRAFEYRNADEGWTVTWAFDLSDAVRYTRENAQANCRAARELLKIEHELVTICTRELSTDELAMLDLSGVS